MVIFDFFLFNLIYLFSFFHFMSVPLISGVMAGHTLGGVLFYFILFCKRKMQITVN